MKQSLLTACILATVGIAWYWYPKKPTIRDDSIIVVGTNAEYPPFSFIDNDTIVGFDIDIAREVCKRLHKTMKLVDMSFDALLPKLQYGSLDIIAAGMSATPERAKKIHFTTPYFEGDPLMILSRAEQPLYNLEELFHYSSSKKEIVVNEGYTADLYVSSYMNEKPSHNVSIRRLGTPAEAILALKSGKAQAFIAAKSSIDEILSTTATNSFFTAVIPNTAETYSLALSLKFPALLSKVQIALDSMRHDGTLTTLKRKWKLS